MVAVDEPDIAASLARIDRHMERLDAHMERQEAMFGDMRQFMHEITLRVERGGREVVRELRDLRAESRAQTQALLQLIDRIDRIDPGAASA